MRAIAQCVAVFALGVAAAVISGCPNDDFLCGNDGECKIETIQGFCEANRYCSFPAADCDSGRRYGAQAGDGLAGTCVPVDDAGSATEAAIDSGTMASTSSMTAADSSVSSSTASVDDTAGITATTSSSSSSSSAGQATEASDTGTEDTTGPPTRPWFDDFERPDSPSLGNGWIERSPATFGLVGGHVVFEGLGAAYQDAVFYRPFDEALLDLEVSIEFTYVKTIDFSTPQLHTRIQAESLDTMSSINAYIVYISQPDGIDLSRIEGDVFASTATEPIDPPLVQGETYRLSLRVIGTDPVELAGRVEGLVGEAWTPVQTVLLTDSDPTRITEAGSFGASGSNSLAFEYDNFTVVPEAPPP